MNYPNYLQFKTHGLKRLAEELRPHSKAFFEGGILCNPSEGWENVFFHCLSEAMTVKVLGEALNWPGTETLVLAAFLHDAYKRPECEAMDGIESNRAAAFLKTEEAGSDWLISLGYSSEVVELQSAYGDGGARDIFLGEITDVPRRLLHYVDDITWGDQIVTIEERMKKLEATPRYAAQNESYKTEFGGYTLYQAKRIIDRQTEIDISGALGLQQAEDLVPWILQKCNC